MLPLYLFNPHPQDPNRYLKTIYREFEKVSYGTDSRLILLIDSKKDFDSLMQTEFIKTAMIFRDEIDLEDLIRQIDFLITGDNPNENELVELAWKHRIRIVSFKHLGKNIFRDFPIDPKVESYKTEMNRIVNQNLFQIYPPSDYEYLLSHQGLGETLTMCFLMHEYQKRIGKKIILLCGDKNRGDLFKFCPYVDKTIMISWEIYSYLKIFVGMRDFFDLHFDRDIQEKSDRIYESNPYESSITRKVRTFLNLESEVPIKQYSIEIPPGDFDIAKKTFQEMNLHAGRTILLITSGYQYSNLNHHRDFFIKLVKRFRESGFDVVTNSQTQELPNVPNVFLPIIPSIAFVQLCGNIVSIPTGWSESMCAFSSYPIKYSMIMTSVHDQFYNPSKFLIDQLRNYGDDFVDVSLQIYRNFYDQIFSRNIRYNLYKFAESELEEQKLIAEIVENISR